MTTHFEMNEQSGFLSPATLCLSSHCDARPMHLAIDMIVIHNISLPPGEFGTPHIEAFFQGNLDKNQHLYFESIAHLRVSSHLLIKRTGEVVQFVPFQKRAWHAGVSSFQGKTACNDFSIGIELEGTDSMPYTEEQYTALIQIIRLLLKIYPAITQERIVGHSDIAPGRKTDPGPLFDWAYLRGKLS